MRAGKLRHSITFQHPVQTTDGFGGPVNTWQDFATVKSSVETIGGREFLAAQAAQSEASVRFNCRYVDGIDAKKRIVYNGKYYDIINVVDPEERHRELIILTKQGVNEG